MAEFISADEVEVEGTVKVTLNYEDYYLSTEAARKLRDELHLFIHGT